MLDHFCAKGPKFWWVVTSGLTYVLDHKNLTKAQKVLFELDCDAYCYLMEALSFKIFDRINSKEPLMRYERLSNTPTLIPLHEMMASSRRRSQR
jgi:hypothetical protein